MAAAAHTVAFTNNTARNRTKVARSSEEDISVVGILKCTIQKLGRLCEEKLTLST